MLHTGFYRLTWNKILIILINLFLEFLLLSKTNFDGVIDVAEVDVEDQKLTSNTF